MAFYCNGKKGICIEHTSCFGCELNDGTGGQEVTGVVLCRDCIIKKAVLRKGGTVWRCPHRTGDVKMEGYCESGVRADGDF